MVNGGWSMQPVDEYFLGIFLWLTEIALCLSFLFLSLKLSLHCFCSPPHCFYSLYHRSSFSSVARSGCSLIHWINSFLTKITHSNLCESSSYAFWCMNSGQFPKRPFSVFHRLIKLQGKSGDSRDRPMIACNGAMAGGG